MDGRLGVICMLEMKNGSKCFGKKNPIMVLNHVDFSLQEGKITAVMGASGTGKSTLARCLLFLERLDEGEIFYNETLVQLKNHRQMMEFRRKVQYISQRPESFFDHVYKLGTSVMETAKIHKLDMGQTKEKLAELLELTKLNSAVLERYPYQVSGGEIQRLALCRALLLKPEILILDEVTSMLDVSVQAQVLSLLKKLQKEMKLTYLFISHEAEVVNYFADRVVEIKNGRLNYKGEQS